jgi:hypothetical protein
MLYNKMLFNLFIFPKLLGVYKSRCGLEDNIEVDLENMLCESVEWFHVTQHKTLLLTAHLMNEECVTCSYI